MIFFIISNVSYQVKDYYFLKRTVPRRSYQVANIFFFTKYEWSDRFGSSFLKILPWFCRFYLRRVGKGGSIRVKLFFIDDESGRERIGFSDVDRSCRVSKMDPLASLVYILCI